MRKRHENESELPSGTRAASVCLTYHPSSIRYIGRNPAKEPASMSARELCGPCFSTLWRYLTWLNAGVCPPLSLSYEPGNRLLSEWLVPALKGGPVAIDSTQEGKCEEPQRRAGFQTQKAQCIERTEVTCLLPFVIFPPLVLPCSISFRAGHLLWVHACTRCSRRH